MAKHNLVHDDFDSTGRTVECIKCGDRFVTNDGLVHIGMITEECPVDDETLTDKFEVFIGKISMVTLIILFTLHVMGYIDIMFGVN